MSKEAMIQEIFNAMKASNSYISGDLFFALAFRTESELRMICRELYIKV